MTSAEVIELSERRPGAARMQIEWLKAVADDVASGALTSSVFVLAFRLNGYAGNETREAWPSQETLAVDTGMSARTVRTLIDDLVTRGHLEVVPGRGRNTTSRYRLLNRKPASAKAEDKPETDFHVTTTETGSTLPQLPVEKRKSDALKPEISRKKSGSPLPTELNKELTKELSLTPTGNDLFENWYRAYPRHVSKHKARISYFKIVSVSTASPETLLSGAKRYAQEQKGKDQKYIAHPATWLNQRRWEDEPEVPPAQQAIPGARADGLIHDGVRWVKPMGPA